MENLKLFGNRFILSSILGIIILISLGFTYYTNNSVEKTEISVIEKPVPYLTKPNNPIQIFLMHPDSIENRIKDSLFVLDSLKLDSLSRDSLAMDSTARLKYFKHQRVDKAYTEFSEKKKSLFFAQPSARFIKRDVKIDSSGSFVIITETIAGKKIRPELKIPFDEYIKMRIDSKNKDDWQELGYKYDLKSSKKDLSEFLSDITKIEIPLPSNSFLSIFGKPVINLDINGAVDIHGAWKSETTEGLTVSRLGNTRNEPDFKQQVQVSVKGTIGDKLSINADWNTERTFQYENQLKLKYTGYEDEIIQSIEAGNVSLQTSPLVGGSEALFGIKAKFQFGPLKLTALASQKKSEVEEVSVSGGSSSQDFEIHPYDYALNHYFVDSIYASTSLDIYKKYYSTQTPTRVQAYEILDLEVWKSTRGTPDPSKERKANAYITLPARNNGYVADFKDPNKDEVEGQSIINSRFIRLELNSDYYYNKATGVITFTSTPQDDEALAVAYRRQGGVGNVFYGDFLVDVQSDTSQVMVLKLIKPVNLVPPGTNPSYTAAWKHQLRNIYPIGGRDIKQEGFEFNINFLLPGAEPQNNLDGKNYVTIFGLDKVNSGGSPQPDGAFDFGAEANSFINAARGEIIFPVLEPFGRDFPAELSDSLRFDDVYTTTPSLAKIQKQKDKFVLAGKYSASSSSVYNIGINVVENSVKVLMNGNALSEGSDYSVDYTIGRVTIRNDAALATGNNLRITYEKNDLIQLASKTLLGLRGVFDFSKKTQLGFSFLNLNEKTLSDKVRIGEEPLNNSIMGLDFKTGGELPFLTNLIDDVISTKQMSTFSLTGEFAYIIPDPNTKKSNIVSDNDQSIAYIDDFEGSKRIIPMGVSYTEWSDLSIPKNMADLNSEPDSVLMSKKAKSLWYNILPSDVNVQAIWPERQVGRQDQQITVLDFEFRPDQRGQYNAHPGLANLKQNWGGIMKGIPSSASNLIEENVEFIEFWAQILDAPADAKLHFDLGLISEDVIPNGVYNTEDNLPYNGKVDEGEDLGIDRMNDAQERIFYNSTEPDPSGDNFNFALGGLDFENINGSEGNFELTRSPDSEDLNNNTSLDRINSFFRYTIPLDTLRANNPFVTGGGNNGGWYQYRIPLKDFTDVIGSPSLSNVKNFRIWINGVEENIHLRFVDINLLGSQWRKTLVPGIVNEDDEVLTISTVSIEENPEYYSPPGVQRERDRTNTEETVLQNEQSLEMTITDLEDGQKREIFKDLPRPEDLFNYKEMKMFVHGDLNDLPGSISNFNNLGDYGSELYFRFGVDSLNFYEYRLPLKAGWQELAIEFAKLTALKQQSPSKILLYKVPIDGKEGHSYGVKGNPTLTRVTFFTLGIINPDQNGPDVAAFTERVSGKIWINELRVLGADDTKGWAYRTTAGVKVADLFDVRFNLNQTDPYFHKLNQRFGSRVDKKSWGTSVNFDVLKLIPTDMAGSNLKINYSRSEAVSKPLYLPGTDILVEEAATQTKQSLVENGKTDTEAQDAFDQIKSDVQTISISETWTLSNIKLKIPTKKWWVEDTFNSLSFGFNYNKSLGRNPTTLNSKNWVWNADIKYAFNFSRQNFFFFRDIPLIGPFFEIFKDYKDSKFNYSPQSFSSGISAKRNRNFSLSRNVGADPNIQRDFTAKRNFGFRWKLTEGGFFNWDLNYNANVSSSLNHLLTDAAGLEKTNSEIWNDIFEGQVFGKATNYSQTFDLKVKPKLPSLWNISRFFTITAGYNVTYNWRNNLAEETLGKSATFSNRIQGGITLRWKSLTDPLFKESTPSKNTGSSNNRNRGRGRGRVVNVDDKLKGKDSTGIVVTAIEDTAAYKPSAFTKAFAFMKGTMRWLFFDYENFSFNFSQNNSQSGGGLAASGNGFSNFWGVSQEEKSGPSRLFMLGLSYDPGKRAPNASITDNFSQKNNFTFKTSRPLWDGAKIDLNWRVEWGINKSTTINTEDDGSIVISNISSTGNLSRSFLSLPPSLFLTVFKSGISKVNENYNPNSSDPNANLSAAFIQGMESMPLLSKIPILKDVAKYVPRPNWRVNWSGLEKVSIFKNFAERVSLTHSYTSDYREGWRITPDGDKETQSQKISYGFNPLFGLNITFNKMWNGNFTGSLKFNTKTAYDLGQSTRNITETFSKEINLSMSYKKSGFELPLFGLALKNDIEMSVSYSRSQNSVVLFEMDNFSEEGKPQDGTIRTSLEPRIKYVMSSKVTLSLFYRRTSVEPEGASKIPPTTTNEAGLDVRVTIN